MGALAGVAWLATAPGRREYPDPVRVVDGRTPDGRVEELLREHPRLADAVFEEAGTTPQHTPDAIADRVLAQWDRNGDGAIALPTGANGGLGETISTAANGVLQDGTSYLSQFDAANSAFTVYEGASDGFVSRDELERHYDLAAIERSVVVDGGSGPERFALVGFVPEGVVEREQAHGIRPLPGGYTTA